MSDLANDSDRFSLLEMDMDGKPSSDSTPAPQASDARAVSVADFSSLPAPKIIEIEDSLIDQEAVRRLIEQENAAKRHGFTLEPPVYELGTVVNEIGVGNAKRRRAEWEELPFLGDACQALVERVAAEDRTDIKTDLLNMTMLEDGRIKIDGLDPMTVTERFVETAGMFAAGGGGSFLNNCPAWLRAQNFNHFFKNGVRVDKRATTRSNPDGLDYDDMVKQYVPREVTVRTRKSSDGLREAMAVTGPRFGTMDVDKVAAKVYDALAGKGDSRAQVTYDGYTMKMDVLFHSNLDASKYAAGEIFRAGVHVKAADDGSGAISISTSLLRNRCRNLLILSHADILVGRRRHSGRTQEIGEKIEEYLQTSEKHLDYFVKAWGAATAEDIIEKYGVGDIRECFRGLVMNRVVTVPGVRPDDLINKLVTAWQEEPVSSKAGVINALTRMAHTETWSSWKTQEELEEKAGELVFAKTLNCVYKETEDLNDVLGGF